MKTAVEFLQNALSIHLTFEQKMQFEGLFQQAKEMEKNQIIEAVNWGALSESGEIYYKDKYINYNNKRDKKNI